jgi:hypothetical protein
LKVPLTAPQQASARNSGATLRDDAELLVDGWSADGPTGTTTQPTWFGPSDASLAGWWHLPPGGEARAVAVLFAPVGREYVVTTLTMRILAGQLAQAGIATLRFDLPGIGDSAGSQHDEGLIDAWQRSVDTALDEARLAAGGLPVAAVGMRMGALLLALAVNDKDRAQDLDAVVLWDPCLSGKAFLRESQALRQVSFGTPTPNGSRVEGMGLELSGDDAGQLSGLTFPGQWNSSAPTLVLHRGSEPKSKLADSMGQTVTWLPVHHQEALLEPEWIKPRAPVSSSASVAEWLRSVVGNQTSPVRPEIRLTAELRDALGRTFTETLIPSLAPASGVRLFGVLTEPAVATGQTVVFINTSIETHMGPGRMWTELSRLWAVGGVRSLRMDLSGLGESGVREGQPAHVSYSLEAVRDVEAGVRAVCDDLSQVTLVGLCSGAYAAVEAALHLRPARVATINLPARFLPPELLSGGSASARKGTSLPPGPIRFLVRISWMRSLKQRLPVGLSLLLERLGVLNSPWAPLHRLADAGVEVIFIAGEADGRPFTHRRERELASLRRRGLKWHLLPRLDHSMLRADGAHDIAVALSAEISAPLPPPDSRQGVDMAGVMSGPRVSA